MPRDFSAPQLLDRLIVTPGRKIKLAKDFATSWKEGRAFGKRQAAERLREGIQLLSEFQSKLYAQNQYPCWSICRLRMPQAKTGPSSM